MPKKILIFLILSIVAFCSVHIAIYAEDNLLIYSDQTKVSCQHEPYIFNDCTMIYYKDIADILGVDILWNTEKGLIEVSRYEYVWDKLLEYSMRVDDLNVIQLNNSVIEIETAPSVVDGNLYLPLRAVCELLCAKVEWDAEEYSVNIITETKRPLLNGHLGIILPVYANAFDSVDSIVMDDNTTNLSYIGYNMQGNEIQIYVRGLFCKTSGDIESDALNLGYDIDWDKKVSNSEIEAVSEVFDNKYDNDTKSGRILINTKDGFLWELDCDIILPDDTANFDDGVEELWNRVKTITLEESYNLNEKDVDISMFDNQCIIHVPEGYIFYTISSEGGGIINITKPSETNKKQPILSSAHYKKNTNIPVKTKESTFLGKNITWNICDNGTAYADFSNNQQWCIENSNEEEIDEFIYIVENIVYYPLLGQEDGSLVY